MSTQGFANEEPQDIAVQSGETATLKVKLLVGSEKAEVTVYGTAQGVRADAQIGRSLESPQIDETPILGRKVSSLLNAPSPFDRTATGQTRTVAAANLTRPIVPVNGGLRQVSVLTNLGVADYNGLQTQISYRGHAKMYASVSYTLSKATNTTEPDGNGIGPSEAHISRLGEVERGPSVVDQRHRAVITFTRQLPYNLAVATVTQLASSRPYDEA